MPNPQEDDSLDTDEVRQFRMQKRRKFGENEKFGSYLEEARNAEEDDPKENEYSENEGEIEPFNMKNEMKEGRFDEDGNFVWNLKKRQNEDVWLQTVDQQLNSSVINDEGLLERLQKEMSTKNDVFLPKLDISSCLFELTSFLKICETPTLAMKRLKAHTNRQKKTPSTKEEKEEEKQKTENFNKIIEICDDLLTSGINAYFMTKEEIEDKIQTMNNTQEDNNQQTNMWMFRWLNNYEEVYGPFDGLSMKSWLEQGYFNEENCVDVCLLGEDIWKRYNEVDFVCKEDKEMYVLHNYEEKEVGKEEEEEDTNYTTQTDRHTHAHTHTHTQSDSSDTDDEQQTNNNTEDSLTKDEKVMKLVEKSFK